MGTKNAHSLPGQLTGGNLIASLFNAFSPRHGDEDKPYFSQYFQVVALPQAKLGSFALRPGDLLIRRMYAHPKRARMGVVKEVFGRDKVSMLSDKGLEVINIGEMGRFLNWEMMGLRGREDNYADTWGEDILPFSPPPPYIRNYEEDLGRQDIAMLLNSLKITSSNTKLEEYFTKDIFPEFDSLVSAFSAALVNIETVYQAEIAKLEAERKAVTPPLPALTDAEKLDVRKQYLEKGRIKSPLQPTK